MKISLSSLCLILTLTFSALACNQSDPFNQNANSSEKIKIDSSIGSENPEKIKTGLGENANNKYKTALIVANIVAGAAGLAAARNMTLAPPPNNGWMMASPFIAGAVLNGVSALDLDAKDSKINLRIGVTNLVWGVLNGACAILYYYNPKYCHFSFYFGVKGMVNLANAVYRLSSVRKQKN